MIAPVRQFGPPLEDQIRPMAYTELQSMFDAGVPPREPVLSERPLSAGDQRRRHRHRGRALRPRPLPPVHAVLPAERGRHAAGDTAYAHRDALYNLVLTAQWLDPGESERHVRWTRELWQALRPYATGGVYVNHIGREEEDGADQVRAAYGANYQRLAELKQKYDPTNLFRHNQNIKPAV